MSMSRPSSAQTLAVGGVVWAFCIAWWLVCFFSDWSWTGGRFMAISGAAAVMGCIVGGILRVARIRWAAAVLGGALAAVATVAVGDYLAYEIGSNL